MIRPVSFVLPGILTIISPLNLAAQTADTRQGIEAISADLFASGGCAIANIPGAQSGHGFDLTNLNRAISACDDFFGFADGGWVENNPIPAAYPSWGSSNKLRDDNEETLHKILDQAAADKNATPGSNWQKIGDFYASCMNGSEINAAGMQPLQPELERIRGINDIGALQSEIARLHRQGVGAVFNFGSEQDYKNSALVIAAAQQGGLGLPDRDYYTGEGEGSAKLRAEYLQHVASMFKLAGDGDATGAAEAKVVMEIEASLAKASMTRVELRDPNNSYHKMTLSQLRELTPHFAWNEYFKEVGSPAVSEVNIRQPEFFKEVDAAFTSVSLADWKTYLPWQLINNVAGSLPSKFVDEDFDFYGRTLRGTKELLPRWRRCVQATDANLGEALGQFYVKANFPPEAKAKAVAMVKDLMAALREDLATLDWMSPETRKQAAVKLDAITIKIGYPDKWIDYSSYKVDRGPYVENVLRGDEFETARQLSKIGKPVNRTEWGITPPTVNAYYSPSLNEIVFPAGILQPPFYDANRDEAMSYGGIGSVIGHELTHGFDDQGARFDAQGNLRNWWTPEDLKNFQERGDCIAKQFSEFEVEPGLHENGKLVEGESIADLGGLTIAYAALEKSFKGNPAAAKIDGFTPEQRFFLGFAQIWAGSATPEFARLIVATNPHPLGRYRVNGAVSNMRWFVNAWGCKTDSPMIRTQALRCRIW